MISRIRGALARLLSGLLTVLTLGRVELNRTGRSTAVDDALGDRRSALTRMLDPDVDDADED